MPYIVYRCDLSQETVTKQTQAVRFRAVILSDKMNVLDEIDLVCSLDDKIIPSPTHLDENYVNIKDVSESEMPLKKFQDEIQEWFDHQITKRRGSIHFVPARGLDSEDHRILPMALNGSSAYGALFEDPGKKKLYMMDVQILAEAILGQSKTIANDDGYPSDVLAIEKFLLPRPYLPFYLQKDMPGDMIVPAFHGGVETLRYASQNCQELLVEHQGEPLMLSHPEVLDNPKTIQKGMLVQALERKQETPQPYYIVETFQYDGEEYALLSVIQDRFAKGDSRKSQKAFAQEMRQGKGSFRTVRISDIPQEALIDQRYLKAEEKADYKSMLDDMEKRPRMCHKVTRAAMRYLKQKHDFSVLFNEFSDDEEQREQDVVSYRSECFNKAALYSGLNRKTDEWINFNDAETDTDQFDPHYKQEWLSYLKAKRRKLRP